MASRLLRGRQVAAHWGRGRAAARRFVASAPATFTYLFVLLITTWVLQTSSAAIANRLLLERSTNLHQLARDPVRVLFASAFWLSSSAEFLLWLVLLSLVVAPFEQRLGRNRTIGVFATGHVFATLLTAAGLWLALRTGTVQHSVVNAKDVGASYGFFAVAACLTYLLDRQLRTPYAVGLVALVCTLAATSRTFTDFGHLIAVALGFACHRMVRGHAVGAPVGERIAAAINARLRPAPEPSNPR